MILSTHGIVNSGSSNPLNTNLYAVYKAESNANDSLGNYNGTAVGGLTYSAGKSGNAFTFNGTNTYISLPDSFKFSDSGQNAFSISLWGYLINPGTIASGLFTNVIQNGPNLYGWMIWHYNEQIYFNRYDGINGYSINTGTPLISMNTWSHIVISRKNGASKLYVNGNLLASDSTTANTAYTTTHYPTIGARQSYLIPVYDWFCANNSKIDEVNVYNKELTATEVTNLYNSGTGKFYPTF